MNSTTSHHDPVTGDAATISDVARLAGVSISTVSRVVNGTAPVSGAVAARVEAAMQTLNYVPRAAARNLASRRSHTLGLLLAVSSGDYFGPLLAGVEGVAAEHGYDLLVSTAGRLGPQSDLPRSLGRHNTDGVLVFAGCLTADALRHLHTGGARVVLVHASAPEGLNIPCVTIENKAAARAAVEHLIEAHGRHRVVLLRGPDDQEDSHWRERGYRQAHIRHGLDIDPALCVPGDFNHEIAERSVARLLAEGVPFDGIFTGDDDAAVGALRALHAAGVRVPEDVAVVGFDDQRLAAALTPPLTTVRAPTEEVGAEAARQLIALIEQRPVQPVTLLPTTLVHRRSCGCFGV